MTIFFDKQLGKREHYDLQMFFDINGHEYFITNTKIDEVDFFIADNNKDIHESKKTIRFDIFHNYDNQVENNKKLLNKFPSLYILTNAVEPNFNHSRLINVDFLFNRTKAYYQQFPFSVGTKRWYFDNQFSFIGCELTPVDTKQKIFVSPCKTYSFEQRYRLQIYNLMKQYSDIGYVSNPTLDGSVLYTNSYNVYATIDWVEQLSEPVGSYLGYSPPHNAYYQNTFISVYGETIEIGKTIAVTEKTYDPLIKGHFILPFSCCGFIKFLKSKGILFPTFIDYSYDNVEDDDLRFIVYKNEVERLMNFDLQSWKQFYFDNLTLLHKNQLYFAKKNYEQIDFSCLT